MAFGCPRCGTVSQSATDEAEGYCVRCHDFTGKERIRYGHLPLLDVFEMRELLALVPDPANPLHTAIAEAILNARSERHSRAIQALYAVSRMLATMELTTMPGTPEVTGLTIFERALRAIESFVRDHGVVEAHRRPDDDQVIDVPPDPPPWLMELLRAPSPLALAELLAPEDGPPQ
jgi:hypothetical protein